MYYSSTIRVERLFIYQIKVIIDYLDSLKNKHGKIGDNAGGTEALKEFKRKINKIKDVQNNYSALKQIETNLLAYAKYNQDTSPEYWRMLDSLQILISRKAPQEKKQNNNNNNNKKKKQIQWVQGP